MTSPSRITLTGSHVELRPLELAHAPDLLAAAADEGIWTYLTVPQPMSQEAMEGWIEEALRHEAKGDHLPFAIWRREDQAFVGSTRYLDIRPFDGSVEIGWTWLGSSARRTAVNTECKFLLLRHAFESLGAIRVQLKTDAKNERSRSAIERIGGQLEGVLRNYQRYWHGASRDTAMYSLLADEWPAAKKRLEAKLG